VHHHPVGPPFAARPRGIATRRRHLSRRALHRGGRRLALAAVLSVAITAIVLGVPVLSGSSAGTPSVALESSSSPSSGSFPSSGGSPVVMGRDGKPVTSADFAGLNADATYSSAPTVEAAGSESSGAVAPADTPTPGSPASGPSTTATPGAAASTGRGGSTASGSASGAPSPTAGSPTTTAGSVAPSEPRALPDTPQAAERAAAGEEEQLLGLVNAARAEAGCAAVVPDGSLAAVAQAHSADMRDSGLLGLPASAGGSVLDLGGRAVTLAHGSDDPAAVLEGWLADPGDRATVLDCGLHSVGIGVAEGPDGVWWTQLLG
jgi:uncharacterized protein YkwD